MEPPQSLHDQAGECGPVASEEDVYTAFFSNTSHGSTSSGTLSTSTASSDCSPRFPSSATSVDLTINLDGRDSATAWHPSPRDTTTETTSFFDWNNWEDWSQWDGDYGLLNSPSPLATNDGTSYPVGLPHSATGEAIAPIDRNSSDGGLPIGRTHVPLSESLLPPADFMPQWTEEYLNLDFLGESQPSTVADTCLSPQFARSSQTSPLHSSDLTDQSLCSTSSKRWASAASPEPSHNLPNKKRKPSVSEDEAGSTPAGRKRLLGAKSAHNIIEKRYRTNLNDKIDALGKRLPNLQAKYKKNHQSSGHNEDEDENVYDHHGPKGQKINKAVVLTEAADYIRELEERIKKHNDQMSTMQIRLDVFKALAAARSPEIDTGRRQDPIQWRGIRGNAADIQYQANTAIINQASPPSRDVRPVGRQNTSRGGYMSKLMVGSLAGLMVMHGLGENDQAYDGPSARGLFSLPTEYIGHLGDNMWSLGPSNSAEFALLLRNFHTLFKVLLLFGAVIYIISPSFFDSKLKEEVKAVPCLATKSALPLGSPVEVRRSAWLTAIQTVWVPQNSLLQQLAALLLKSLNLGIRKVVGWHGYAMLTGATEEQEVARIRAWEIAIDAQLTGGDAEINLSRLALTILASETLPVTPYRLMLKALHIHVLLWELSNSKLRGRYLYRSFAMKFARYQWAKARKLQIRISLSLPLNDSSDSSRSDALPDYLVNLLDLDIDTVMQHRVVQRAYNLAWDKPTDDKVSDCIDGMNTVINDVAIGSPLDALSAWCSCVKLHRALVNFLGSRTGLVDSNADFQHDLDLALKISPTGSLVQSYSVVACAVLSNEHRGANIAAALQVLPPVSKSGTGTPTMADAISSSSINSQTHPELRLALQCAMAVALLKRAQYKEEAIAVIRNIQIYDNDFGLLGFTAAYNWLDAAFRDNTLANETRGELENVSGALKLWMSGKQGRNSGLGVMADSLKPIDHYVGPLEYYAIYCTVIPVFFKKTDLVIKSRAFAKTLKPPTLHDDHQLRRWMSHLGMVMARHALATIAVTVSIGAYLSLPVLHLHQPSFSSKYPNLSGHAWTSILPFPGGEGLIPDISIKQLWIQGSWIKALERETLLEAVDIQEALLGPISSWATALLRREGTSGIPGEPAKLSALESDAAVSFIHSPLLYWNSSAAIESTDSILAAINSPTTRKSPANITLTPASVLLGPVWSGDRLVAADALVVSLFYKAGSRAGDIWDERVEALTQAGEGRWDIHIKDDTGTGSKLLQYQSRLASAQDEAIFFAAYVLVALFVFLGFKHLNSLRSKISLLIPIALQGCFSICCSFAVATYFRLDISTIPLEAYPFIVLVGALDNIFRLIHEVERTPLLDRPERRVSIALGSVGHLLLISVVQNVFILLLLSKLLSPGLAAFCCFAALSLVIDTFFFWSFFVAILAINLRNYGIQDSFENVGQHREGTDDDNATAIRGFTPQQRRDTSWRPWQIISYFPRVKGTVAILLFISMLAWHFLPGKVSFDFNQEFASVPTLGRTQITRDYPTRLKTVLGQTADSRGWLESQDRNTMKEIHLLADARLEGFVARIYSPLIVMPKSTNRNASLKTKISKSFPMNSYTPTQLWLSIVALCSLLTYFVSNCSSHSKQDEEETRIQKSDSLCSVRYLPHGHTLDVYILSASTKPYLASIGFDHEIRVWGLKSKNITSHLTASSELQSLWPAASVAIDDKGEWLAICSKRGEVGLWNIKHQTMRIISASLHVHIVLCFFVPGFLPDCQQSTLLMVGANGVLIEVGGKAEDAIVHQVCAKQIRSSHLISHRHEPLRFISVTEDDEIYMTVKRENGWMSQALHIPLTILQQPARLRFTVIPDLKMVGLAFNMDTSQLYLIDFLSASPIYVFQPKSFKHSTLRTIHSPPQQCLSCGAVALVSFSIAYSEVEDGRFTMLTLSAEPDPRKSIGLFCLRAERDARERRCIGFHGSTENSYSMSQAGAWEATAANGVAGHTIQKRRERGSEKAQPTRRRVGSLDDDRKRNNQHPSAPGRGIYKQFKEKGVMAS
ncbi:hypothetical protein V502_09049 [Pseudogymnoascus sp. VKM F-4520 (FW-2644)]|nr:hypothetical protein V502_09049 [Pseudogymnoascus sp. VKM F-4520 (FW-2644)]